MTGRSALCLAAVCLVLGVFGCAAQPQVELQPLEGRNRVPRRWFDAVHDMARPLARQAHDTADRRVAVVAFEDRTPLLDLDVDLFQATTVAALRHAGWEVDDEDPLDGLAHVTGDLALVGSVTETTSQDHEVCVELTTALFERKATEWTSRTAAHASYRIVVPLTPPKPRPQRR